MAYLHIAVFRFTFKLWLFILLNRTAPLYFAWSLEEHPLKEVMSHRALVLSKHVLEVLGIGNNKKWFQRQGHSTWDHFLVKEVLAVNVKLRIDAVRL